MSFKISLTSASEFVITARNKENSNFYIQPKSAYEREMEMEKGGVVISTGNEGPRTEAEIIKMIKAGKKFYTHFDGEFTIATVVNNHLRSVKNETVEDNIDRLPIASFL